jgi:hypothetical protein
MSLINFICPADGRAVTSAINRQDEPIRPLETVICPCCDRFHVLDTATGTVARSADVTPINLLNYYTWDRFTQAQQTQRSAIMPLAPLALAEATFPGPDPLYGG